MLSEGVLAVGVDVVLAAGLIEELVRELRSWSVVHEFSHMELHQPDKNFSTYTHSSSRITDGYSGSGVQGLGLQIWGLGSRELN